MLLISLEGYTPSIGQIWTEYRIEEALSDAGPWTSIQDGDLYPLDTDPNNPAVRNFQVPTDTINGWYRVVFVDDDGDFEYTIPRWNNQTQTILFTPTVSQVGALLRARTKDSAGNELGTFTEDTRPTREQCDELIQAALDTVMTRTGSTVPQNLIPETQRLVALRAAMLVEAGFFPEQVATGRSVYTVYSEIWDKTFGTEKYAGTLIRAISEAKASPDGSVNAQDPGVPLYSFPSSVNIGRRRF